MVKCPFTFLCKTKPPDKQHHHPVSRPISLSSGLLQKQSTSSSLGSSTSQSDTKAFDEFLAQVQNKSETGEAYVKQLSRPLIYLMPSEETHDDKSIQHRLTNNLSGPLKKPIVVTTFGDSDIEAIFEWSFDAFAWDASHHQKGLLCLAETIFEYEGLFYSTPVHKHNLLCLLDKMDREYTRMNTHFHNKFHAMFVLQSVFLLVQNMLVFRPLEKLALYISAIVHDFRHPGVTNHHMVLENNKWARIYNDRSPLENMHLYKFFQLVYSKSKYDFLSCFPHPVFLRLRHMIVTSVLATDLEYHKDIYEKFKLHYRFHDEIDVTSLDLTKDLDDEIRQVQNPADSEDNKLVLMQMVLKCADLSHLWASYDLFVRMVMGLQEELFVQGDIEREKWGRVFSPMSDRRNIPTSLLANETHFFRTIAFPIFLGMSLVFPNTIEILRRALNNYNRMHHAGSSSFSSSERVPPLTTESNGSA